nr:hypothetical protein [Gammaproteobacteria bacterium]
DALRERLVISAVLRALLQLGLFVDLYTGMAALGLIHAVVGDVPFLSVYLAVLVHGTLLSIVLLLLMGIVHLVQLAYRRITARVEDVSTPV